MEQSQRNQNDLANVQSGMFIEYALEHNGKDLKCKIGDHMRISP